MLVKLYNYLKRKDNLAEGLVVGLVLGLISGLISGLVAGLVVGLVAGLVFGLAVGLGDGLAVGLIAGLAVGLVAGLVSISETLPLPIPLWSIILLFIFLMEFLFYLNDLKPKYKENKVWFTAKRKLEAGFEALLILVWINNIRFLVKTYQIDWAKFGVAVEYLVVGLVGLGIIGLIIYAFLKLNSLRYKK